MRLGSTHTHTKKNLWYEMRSERNKTRRKISNGHTCRDLYSDRWQLHFHHAVWPQTSITSSMFFCLSFSNTFSPNKEDVCRHTLLRNTVELSHCARKGPIDYRIPYSPGSVHWEMLHQIQFLFSDVIFFF